MQKLKTRARSEREIHVRRDKRRAAPRMTRSTDLYGLAPPNAARSGDWRRWWRAGCGSINGVPTCPPGHAYYLDRYHRGAHARSKVLGRRIVRHRLKQLAFDDTSP